MEIKTELMITFIVVAIIYSILFITYLIFHYRAKKRKEKPKEELQENQENQAQLPYQINNQIDLPDIENDSFISDMPEATDITGDELITENTISPDETINKEEKDESSYTYEEYRLITLMLTTRYFLAKDIVDIIQSFPNTSKLLQSEDPSDIESKAKMIGDIKDILDIVENTLNTYPTQIAVIEKEIEGLKKVKTTVQNYATEKDVS